MYFKIKLLHSVVVPEVAAAVVVDATVNIIYEVITAIIIDTRVSQLILNGVF